MFYNPVFILALMCWVMGFIAGRFWYDWGWPALLFWFAKEIENIINSEVELFGFKRVLLSFVLCVSLFLCVSSDIGGRWSMPPAQLARCK